MGEASRIYYSSLPHFTCSEFIRSINGSRIVVTRGTLRVTSSDNKFGRKEEREIELLDGRKVAKGTQVQYPFSLQDYFGVVPSVLFAPSTQHCYQYYVAADRIDFKKKDELAGRGGCGYERSLVGFALIDPVSGQIRHVERSLPQAEADRNGIAAYVAVDYVPERKEDEGQTYLLPARIYARNVYGADVRTFDASYSGCEIHKATVVISNPIDNSIIKNDSRSDQH